MADNRNVSSGRPEAPLDPPSTPPQSLPKKVKFWTNRISKSTLSSPNASTLDKGGTPRESSTLGVLADKQTDEVPGTVLLLSPTRNEPLGIERQEVHRDDDRLSVHSNRSRRSKKSTQQALEEEKKKTSDGRIVLDPQPEESMNDPLNWPAWRRDFALLSLGFYCMVGGGMTPILAAGFNNVAATYNVSYAKVALTTGLYMMGLGVGSVIWAPTAILYGKRPVYLISSVMFILFSVWCALAPSYAQLVVARVLQGIAVSPVECLPSATIAEIFFLHERAFRIGIYTLLLLGGKNLIPLVSAAIIQAKGWRWVFWVVAIVVGFGGALLFLFVPETFWDRTPRPRKISRKLNRSRPSLSSRMSWHKLTGQPHRTSERSRSRSAGRTNEPARTERLRDLDQTLSVLETGLGGVRTPRTPIGSHTENDPRLPHLHNLNSPYYADLDKEKEADYFSFEPVVAEPMVATARTTHEEEKEDANTTTELKSPLQPPARLGRLASTGSEVEADAKIHHYTTGLRNAPPKPYVSTLKIYNGRLSRSNWFLVACRPFILYAYPAVLWSSMVYALSVGWLIVLSESMAEIYRNKQTYNFSAIQTGLVYLSPFIGGVLGTAVAGRFSDVIVRFMARRNGGIYEPEFRLVMAIPIAISTAIGLMGFGWSAQEKDNFMVPTIFFGVISFGCCIGSTTAITFCVDSYRQFAAEALVTLNFSKNILHGLVWSLFFPRWLLADGPKTVFIAIGGIQLACLVLTIPMYVYGKRARMWTVRQKMMERF